MKRHVTVFVLIGMTLGCTTESFEAWRSRHLEALRAGRAATPSPLDARYNEQLRHELRAMRAKIDLLRR